MKVIKSDGRRNYFKQGFTTIIEFDGTLRDRRMRSRATDYFRARFGLTFDSYILPQSNENWRTQFYSGQRRKSKIYLRDEAEVTLMLLTLDVA